MAKKPNDTCLGSLGGERTGRLNLICYHLGEKSKTSNEVVCCHSHIAADSLLDVAFDLIVSISVILCVIKIFE